MYIYIHVIYVYIYICIIYIHIYQIANIYHELLIIMKKHPHVHHHNGVKAKPSLVTQVYIYSVNQVYFISLSKINIVGLRRN